MEEKVNNFIEYAYRTGRVKDSHEAFVEFLPEKEWHEGNPEYFLKEDSTPYNVYNIGDIVFVKDSIVKTDVIYKIENSQILFKIGTVDRRNIEEYKKAFMNEK